MAYPGCPGKGVLNGCSSSSSSSSFDRPVLWTSTVRSYVCRSTSGGERIRRESSSSQEASSRKDKHRPAPGTSARGVPCNPHDIRDVPA